MRIGCKHLLIAMLSANLLMAFGGYFAVRRLADVAAVQASLERNWEINFNAGGRPPHLPNWADRFLQRSIDTMIGSQQDSFSGPQRNRDNIWRQRTWALFRGPITQIEIFYPERMCEDLGAALARFPSLKRVVIYNGGFTTEDWGHLFSGLQRLRNLEELQVGGHALDDRAIASLKGVRVSKLIITEGELAEFSPAIFARVPGLKELTLALEAIGASDVDPPAQEMQKLIREALPNVKVVFE